MPPTKVRLVAVSDVRKELSRRPLGLRMCAYSYLCAELGLRLQKLGRRVDSVEASEHIHVVAAWSAKMKIPLREGRTARSRDRARRDFAAALRAMVDIQREAEGALGERAWRLVSSFGKLMGGPHSGLYVNGVPFDVQREIVRRLAAGETLLIHLMHTHVSGNYESSSLRWSHGQLTMVFEDREVKA